MSERRPRFDIGHPAPARNSVLLWRVAFGLAGGAVAWSLQLAVTAGVGGLACLGPGGAAVDSAPDWASAVLWAANLAALAVTVAALLVAASDFRDTRYEEGHRSGGVLEAGEGRTRFLSVTGIWMNVLFLIATLASTLSIAGAGACP